MCIASELAIHANIVYAVDNGPGLAILNTVAALHYLSGEEGGPGIEWNLGTLLFAPTVRGPWMDLPAASPFRLSPVREKGFFRVKAGRSEAGEMGVAELRPPNR